MGKKKSTKHLVVVLLGLLQSLSISCAATATEVVSNKIRSGLIEKSDVIALVDLRTIKKLTEADRLPTGFSVSILGIWSSFAECRGASWHLLPDVHIQSQAVLL
jgi:hypothetical protein